MKSRKISFAILAVVVAAFVSAIVVSCKKEKQEQVTSNLEQGVQSSENIDEYLISFKKRMLSATKGGESISLEQAQRDLENLLNFDFGDANYATNILRNDTICLHLSIADGMVDLAELSSAYSTAFQQIRATFHLIDLPEKSVFYVSLSIIENAKSEDAEVEVVLITRSYDESAIGNDFWNRSWKPDYTGGTCDGLYTNIGAARLIEDKLNANIGNYMCTNGSRVYFTNPTNSQMDAFYNIMIDPLGIYSEGHRMFYRHTTNPNSVCIEPDELDYYYNQMSTFFHEYKDYFFHPIPSNHVPLEYFLKMQGNIPNGSSNIYRWILTVYHGKPNCTDTPVRD